MQVSTSARPSTALVHHWLVTMRGGERVLEALAVLYPSADLFTLVCDPSNISSTLTQHRIHTSLLQHFPKATRWYRYYLPFFPLATERLDLSGYDLIISSDAATIKGVRCDPGAVHICYCHTPMRYVWNGYGTYYRAAGRITRNSLSAIRSRLCRWDYEAAQRVTHFVANSKNVQSRIRDCYGRESIVIYPPVDTDRFVIGLTQEPEPRFYLIVSQLVPYKRVDLVIDAFNRCGRRLIVIGDGPDRRKLERAARPNIRFLGSQSQAVVVSAMQECKAFVFAGEEDFGIVMAEAQASGKPVIAFGRGGAVEIVTSGVTGILFEEQSADALVQAIERFEGVTFSPAEIRRSALRFERKRFVSEFAEVVAGAQGL